MFDAPTLMRAIPKKNIVFIVGQSTGAIIYLRNLYFIRKQEGAAADATA